MGFLDSVSEMFDALGVPDPEKDIAKNVESEAAQITEKAINAANAIMIISDRELMKKKIMDTLDEFYALGARAQIHIKGE